MLKNFSYFKIYILILKLRQQICLRELFKAEEVVNGNVWNIQKACKQNTDEFNNIRIILIWILHHNVGRWYAPLCIYFANFAIFILNHFLLSQLYNYVFFILNIFSRLLVDVSHNKSVKY